MDIFLKIILIICCLLVELISGGHYLKSIALLIVTVNYKRNLMPVQTSI